MAKKITITLTDAAEAYFFILFAATLLAILCGCSTGDNWVNHQKIVILKAERQKSEGSPAVVILSNEDGDIYTEHQTFFASTISETFNPGDTIKKPQ